MKTAEKTLIEFAKENQGLIKRWTGEIIFEGVETLIKLMEQFRKEGMEEAFEAGEDNDKFNGSHWIRGGTFEEWYNNQIKE